MRNSVDMNDDVHLDSRKNQLSHLSSRPSSRHRRKLCMAKEKRDFSSGHVYCIHLVTFAQFDLHPGFYEQKRIWLLFRAIELVAPLNEIKSAQ